MSISLKDSSHEAFRGGPSSEEWFKIMTGKLQKAAGSSWDKYHIDTGTYCFIQLLKKAPTDAALPQLVPAAIEAIDKLGGSKAYYALIAVEHAGKHARMLERVGNNALIHQVHQAALSAGERHANQGNSETAQKYVLAAQSLKPHHDVSNNPSPENISILPAAAITQLTEWAATLPDAQPAKPLSVQLSAFFKSLLP